MVKMLITKISSRILLALPSKKYYFKFKKYALLPQKCERFGIFFFLQVV